MRRRPVLSPDFYNLAFAASEARGLFELFRTGRATKQSLYRDLVLTREHIAALKGSGITVDLVVRFRRRVAVELVDLFRRHPNVKPQPFVYRPSPRVSNRKRKLTDGEVQIALERLRDGGRWKDVAQEFGVAVACLQHYIGSKRDFA